uniref:efflux RND transporter periplasmic adaptor subunit n=1 Tax=Candidatus Electronema sp. TaxID=2698783 RepID=UPI004056642B
MKTRHLIISSAAAVCAALVAVPFFWPNAAAEQPAGHAASTKPAEKAQAAQKEERSGEEAVRLSEKELEEFGIELAAAAAGKLDQPVSLPGEIVLNTDRIAHVVPVIAGIVREVRAVLGSSVKTGDVLAVIESRELAEKKAELLAAAERENLALATFKREERLWEKKITSEQEYLNARQALAEARIAKHSAEQHLRALGLSDAAVKAVQEERLGASRARFEIRSPQNGVIIEKHLTLGEHVSADADVFTVADLSSVWADVNVYQKELVKVRKGQKAVLEIGHGIAPVSGTISWISPQIDKETHTAKARLTLPNPDGSLRPGMFVTAKIAAENVPAGIVVPQGALQQIDGQTMLFVREDKGFVPRPVVVGRQNDSSAEIVSGLAAGEVYVSKGTFTLKAQLAKNAFGDGHGH